MPSDDVAPAPAGRRRVRIGRKPRPWLRALVGVAIAVVLGILWIGVRGALAVHHLQQARQDIAQVSADVSAGKPVAASAALSAAAAQSGKAANLTGDPVWHLAGHLPLVGVDLRTAHAVAAAAHLASAGAAPLVLQLSQDLSQGRLRTSGGALDLGVLTALGPGLTQADNALTLASAQLDGVGTGGLGSVQRSRAELTTQLASLLGTVQAAQRVVSVAPGMLGADGARRYFVALQNPAESRGTGGYLGAFAVVTADNGKLTLDSVGTDNQLISPDAPVTTVSPDFTSRWRALGGDSFWGNANLTADFPSAATVWLALYAHETGQHLDGVVALDPEATGYLVSVLGPLTLPDGTRLTGDGIAPYVESGEYSKYPTDADGRRASLKAIIHDAFGSLTSGEGDTAQLVAALSRASNEGRLMIESTRSAEQSVLEAGGVAGELPPVPGPFAALVVDNAAANKLDYYLDRSLKYVSLGCSAPTRQADIDVTLHNAAPASGLPALVAEPAADSGAAGDHLSPGTNRLLVQVYAAQGSTLTSATLDGEPVNLTSQTEATHPVFSLYLNLTPGQTVSLSLTVNEPTSGSSVPFHQQALARPLATTLKTDDCPTDTPLAQLGG